MQWHYAVIRYAAADNGHHDVVRFLMAHKGQIQLDLNQSRSDDGATPLYGACFAGHTNVVEALLENSAVNVNQCRMVDGVSYSFVKHPRRHAATPPVLAASLKLLSFAHRDVPPKTLDAIDWVWGVARSIRPEP